MGRGLLDIPAFAELMENDPKLVEDEDVEENYMYFSNLGNCNF
jgi:hypothetical protein